MAFENKLEAPVLVTGATGFIGRVLVRKLIEAQYCPAVFVLPEEEIPEDWKGKVHIIRGNITDSASVEKAMKGIGTVFHLAAVVTDWGNEDFFLRFFDQV